MSGAAGAPRHRADVRPRWGRIFATVLSAVVVVVALLAAVGVVHGRSQTALDPSARIAAGGAAHDTASASATPTQPSGSSDRSTTSYGEVSSGSSATPAAPSGSATDQPSSSGSTGAAPVVDHDKSLPAESGEGRRVVFSESRQRVWLVDDTVRRTYLVSGSVTDNLEPGTYAVYSRSEHAVGIEDSGTMKWFVRFAHGTNAAIGFHDIPVKDGEPLQTLKQLGTPQSHGCIRQKEVDALAMWDFAQLGTKVVVTA